MVMFVYAAEPFYTGVLPYLVSQPSKFSIAKWHQTSRISNAFYMVIYLQ